MMSAAFSATAIEGAAYEESHKMVFAMMMFGETYCVAGYDGRED